MTRSIPFNPRLLAVASDSSEEKIGYLQLTDAGEPIRIGPLSSTSYKLIQSLFSPMNHRVTRFMPVEQTTERTYINMLDLHPTKELSQKDYEEREATVARAIKSVRRTAAGKYISFTHSDRGGITMEISPEAR